MHLCPEMHATAKKVSLAKIRRRVGENSNEMLKRRPVASIIGEKVKFDKNGKSGENDAFGANFCRTVRICKHNFHKKRKYVCIKTRSTIE